MAWAFGVGVRKPVRRLPSREADDQEVALALVDEVGRVLLGGNRSVAQPLEGRPGPSATRCLEADLRAVDPGRSATVAPLAAKTMSGLAGSGSMNSNPDGLDGGRGPPTKDRRYCFKASSASSGSVGSIHGLIV